MASGEIGTEDHKRLFRQNSDRPETKRDGTGGHRGIEASLYQPTPGVSYVDSL
jgi:hypothetical protein